MTKAINPVYQSNSLVVAPDFNCSATIQPAFENIYALFQCQSSFRFQLSFLLQRVDAIVLFFYGKDFTSVSDNDLLSISANMERFKKYNTLPLAISIDSEESHQSYLNHFMDKYQELLPFPLLSDPTRSIIRHFNVLDFKTGFANRAVFIIDRKRQIEFSFVLGDDRILHSMNTIITMLQMNIATT
ncbi:thioredoxin-like protein [Cunninghamella echinulata]|nr:thioredoxin-like protein [Cunninghamella echinulata]